jgi:hypothetical protein
MNKTPSVLHLVGSLPYLIYDARSYEHQINRRICKTASIIFLLFLYMVKDIIETLTYSLNI